MKKVLVVIISLVLLTGCGSKTLVCSKVEDDTETYKISGDHTFVFNGSNIKDFKSTLSIELKDDEFVKIEDLEDILKEQEKEFSSEGFNTEIKTEGNLSTLVVSSEGDSKNLVNKFFYTEDYSYNLVKKELEKEGYTCK